MFNKEILALEKQALDGLPTKDATPDLLNAYTAYIYELAARRWAEMESRYWVQFGRGF